MQNYSGNLIELYNYNGSFDYSGWINQYYDGNPPELTVYCSHKTLLIVPMLYFIISIVGLFANFVVIFTMVILREYKKSVTNVYILQLAIADFLYLSFLPFQATYFIQEEYLFGNALCKMLKSTRMLSYNASVLFLTMMSLDRFLAINYAMNNKAEKFRSKTFAAIFSAVTWCLGCASVVYIMLKAKVYDCKCMIAYGWLNDADQEENSDYLIDIPAGQMISFDDIEHVVMSQPVHCSYKKKKRLIMYLLANFFVTFLIPVLVICLCYIKIIRRLSKPFENGVTSHTSNRTRKRITNTVIALVVSFIVCWLPYYIFNLARINDLQISKYKCDALTHFTVIMAALNSALNPFFYTFIGKNMKKQWESVVSWARSFRLSVSRRTQCSHGSGRRSRRKSSESSQLSATKHIIVVKQDSFPKNEENKL